jgi:hypothetical protein
MPTLFHYTDRADLEGTLQSLVLLPRLWQLMRAKRHTESEAYEIVNQTSLVWP